MNDDVMIPVLFVSFSLLSVISVANSLTYNLRDARAFSTND